MPDAGDLRARRSTMTGGGPAEQVRQASTRPEACSRDNAPDRLGGIRAIPQNCDTGCPAGRGAGIDMRCLHVRTVAVTIITTAPSAGVASRPSRADQTASADATTIRSPPQRRQPDRSHRSGIRPEPATGSARHGADGTEGRKPDRLLQPTTSGRDVPAHLPRAGATDGDRGPGPISETSQPVPARRGARRVAGGRQAAVHLHPGRSGRRASRFHARPVGDTHACGRRLHILRERRSPCPVFRPLSAGSDLLLCFPASCLDSLNEFHDRRARRAWRKRRSENVVPQAGWASSRSGMILSLPTRTATRDFVAGHDPAGPGPP